MPFTLAHPAAVWPLRRVLPRHQIVPLIVGSMVPDLPNFIPARFLAERSLRHFFRLTHAGIFGSVFNDLPLGTALLVALVVLRGPLTELLSGAPRTLLGQSLARFAGSPVHWLPAPLSVLVGAWAHIVCDSLTHKGSHRMGMGWHLTALHAQIDLGFYAGPVYHLLQYVLSVIGLAGVALWYPGTVPPHCPPHPGRRRRAARRPGACGAGCSSQWPSPP